MSHVVTDSCAGRASGGLGETVKKVRDFSHVFSFLEMLGRISVAWKSAEKLKNVSTFFSGGAVILDVLIVTVVGCNGGGTWSKELLLRLYSTKNIRNFEL